MITMHFEICVHKLDMDLVDRTTGEIYATGADNINNAFNLLEAADVRYDVRIDTGEFNQQKVDEALDVLFGDH
jgi:hypothetical protein